MCPHCGSRKWEAPDAPSGAQPPEKEWAVPEIQEAARAAFTEALGRDPGEAAGTLADGLQAWTAALGAAMPAWAT